MLDALPALLSEYWLQALLTGGFVLLLALPFVWLRGLIKIENDNYKLIINITFPLLYSRLRKVEGDCHDLNEKFKALDKPSNDRALENIAVILKKKISKKPTKLIRPKAKANWRSHAHR